jgi:hypothetical protein
MLMPTDCKINYIQTDKSTTSNDGRQTKSQVHVPAKPAVGELLWTLIVNLRQSYGYKMMSEFELWSTESNRFIFDLIECSVTDSMEQKCTCKPCCKLSLTVSCDGGSVVFCKNMTGTSRWEHSWTKWEAFRASSLVITPLLPTIPTKCLTQKIKKTRNEHVDMTVNENISPNKINNYPTSSVMT